MNFVDKITGWIFGFEEQESIYKTIDGGISWNKQKSPDFWGLSKLFFIDEKTCWIGMDSDALILKTTTDSE